jgi:hypothetical protein
MALKRKFESKRDEIVGGWRKPLNGELHNLFPSLHVSRMRWTWHVAYIVENRNVKEINHLEHLDVDRRLMFKPISKKLLGSN